MGNLWSGKVKLESFRSNCCNGELSRRLVHLRGQTRISALAFDARFRVFRRASKDKATKEVKKFPPKPKVEPARRRDLTRRLPGHVEIECRLLKTGVAVEKLYGAS